MAEPLPAVPRARRTASLITVGDRQVMKNGRWNNTVMAQWVLEHARIKWVPIEQLARVGCGGVTKANKKRARTKVSALFKELVSSHGMFLAVEYHGSHNAASAIKIADLKLAADRQSVEAKIERMRKRKELTLTEYQRVQALLRAAEMD